ncbi:MAG: transporter, family, tetracycline resistance protein [Acidobacteriota bacterium]|jgi:MFS family permease|nr:transporter, family, tetracycline resistance protein [Acidobacteriota bacterium]
MRRSSLLVLFLTVFIDLIGFGMVIPFLSFYAREYGASGTTVGAVVGIYSIMQFFFAPVWGRLSDRVGRRPVLLISLTASCTGYLLFAFTRSLTVLFLSRIVAGIGGANIGTAQAYIADSTTPENRAKGMGLIGAAFGLGFILGPPLSGILSAFGTHRGLPGNLLPGLVAAGLSFTAFLIALSVLSESKPPNLVPRSGLPPQFDRRIWRDLLHNRLLGSLMIGIFLTLLAVAGMEVSVTIHGRERFHFTQLDMAYLFLFMGVIVATIQGGLIGKLSKRVGEKGLIVIGAASFIFGFAAVPLIYSVPLLYGVAFFIAIGQGLCYPSLTSLVSKVSPEGERGSILGLATSVGSLARFGGPILMGFLYDLFHANAFYGGAIMMALALLVAWRMRTDTLNV